MIAGKAPILTGLAATVTVAAAVTGTVLVRGGPRVVVPATAYATADTSNESWWFEPSAAFVPKGSCTPANARPGAASPAEDRLVVRHNSLHFRDGTHDPVEVFPPRPAGTQRLGSDGQLGRLKDGRLLYVEMGRTSKAFTPKPFWHDYAGYLRSTMELFTSSDCGTSWDHALTIDTKDFAGGACAVPQENDDGPWPGGFDRIEVHADPWRGDVYVTTACRGGNTTEYMTEHLYTRILLFRIEPDVKSWTLTQGIQFNYGPPVAVTTTADGSVHLLRCDYAARPQLVRLADRGERLVAVTDVRAWGETEADAACAIAGDLKKEATGMSMPVTELRLAPAGPSAVRVAYHQVVDAVPRVRLYTATYPPLPTGQPCAAMRTAYLGQFAVPDEAVPPVPGCGAAPSFSPARLAGDEGASVVHFDLIAPDVTALGSEKAMASSMLYWMQHSPATGQREVRYRTISANGSWSDAHTASAAPWTPRLGEDTRDADYEYGGYAFVDGRCRYALVWNETHAKPAGPNLYAHYAIVDDLSCTGAVASPAPVVTPSVSHSPLPKPKPSVSPAPKQTFVPPVTAPPPTAAPTSAPPTTPPPKSKVAGVTLSVQQCTEQAGGTWRCSYTAKFTYSQGSGGGFYWRMEGTLRYGCYPSGGGVEEYEKQSHYVEIAKGQTSYSTSGYLTFDKPPNPTDVYGSPGQLSDAHVQVMTEPVRSDDATFASGAICGKP